MSVVICESVLTLSVVVRGLRVIFAFFLGIDGMFVCSLRLLFGRCLMGWYQLESLHGLYLAMLWSFTYWVLSGVCGMYVQFRGDHIVFYILFGISGRITADDPNDVSVELYNTLFLFVE
jgi:hypothetical protein